MQLTQPPSVVVRTDVVNDDTAIRVGEAEEHDAAVLVGGAGVREPVGDPVWRRPETRVKGFVCVADEGCVSVGVLHQGRRRRQFKRG